MLGVVEPMSCGIGGDLFAIVWDAKTRKLYGLNASGRSPAAATIEFFQAKGSSGEHSHSRPAELVGPRLRRRLGPAPQASSAHDLWAELLAPAIDYAEHGFPVSEIIAADWQGAEPDLRLIPTSAACYLPGGHAPAPGTVFRNPGLARSLRTIAEGGRDAFYRGPLADAIVAYSQSAGGLFSHRLRRAHPHLGRSGLDQLPRLRRLGASAQRPGDRRAPDAQPARAVRPEAHGVRNRPRRCT